MNTRIKLMQNAENAKTFGGRRFLGFNKNYSPVWISYIAYRDSGKILIKVTHDLDSLLHKDAILATKRVVIKMGIQNINSLDSLIRRNKKNMGGQVSANTVVYLKMLINSLEIGYGKPFVNGIPSELMFSYVAQAIFEGSYDWESGDTTWNEILKAWNFPSGEYFTIEGLSSR